MSKSDTSPGVIEIQIDDKLNSNLFFRPLQRNIRGRFDYSRVKETEALRFINKFPNGIPGQRLRLDAVNRTLQIIEPLRLGEFANVREQIESMNIGRIPTDETFANVHVPTMLHHMKAAVECGHATVLQGVLPSEIEGEPRLTFFTAPRENPMDRLTAALEAQSAMIGKLLDIAMRRNAPASTGPAA